MKRRSREINIFSMSALDLFASGMGAFILLAVMALPFFPNTGDSRERIKNVKVTLEETRQQRDAARRQRDQAERQRDEAEKLARERKGADDEAERLARQRDEAELHRNQAERRLDEAQRQLDEVKERASDLAKTLAKVRIPDLDVVICLDVTASMEDHVEGLKREISNLAKVLDRLTPSTGIGVVAFGDRRWQRPIHVQDIVATSNMASLERFVGTLRTNMRDPHAGRNHDKPEALAMALDRAMVLNWRSVSQRRYIIVVTDAPAYPEMVEAALQKARTFAVADGQRVSAVMAWKDRSNAEPFLRELAGAGQGQFVDGSGGESMIASVLLAILGI